MVRFWYDDDSEGEEPGLPCKEKLAFDTLQQAMAAANVAEYQHGAHVVPYQCQYCGLWHLSSA
jgi:hypothetical protein